MAAGDSLSHGAGVPKSAPRHSPESWEAIAERLTALRETYGESQAAFARRVGVNVTTWNNFETAVSRISIDNAMRLCRATRVTLDWIYFGNEALLPGELVQRLRTMEAEKRQA